MSSARALAWASNHITSEHLPSVNVKYMCKILLVVNALMGDNHFHNILAVVFSLIMWLTPGGLLAVANEFVVVWEVPRLRATLEVLLPHLGGFQDLCMYS